MPRKKAEPKPPDFNAAINRLLELAGYSRQCSRQMRIKGYWNEAKNFSTAAMCLEYASDRLAEDS